jgi:hypothetical protein
MKIEKIILVIIVSVCGQCSLIDAQQATVRILSLIANDSSKLELSENYLRHATMLKPMIEKEAMGEIPMPFFASVFRKNNDYNTLAVEDFVTILQTIEDTQENPKDALKMLIFKDHNHPSIQRCAALFAIANFFEIKPLLELLVEYVVLLMLQKKESLYKAILQIVPLDLLHEIFYKYTEVS